MKSRLEEIKANHEFRKGEGWELTTLTEDIDWLIEQAEKAEELQRRIDKVIKECAVNWINLILQGKRD
jgi:hypothetical protein